MNVRIVVLCFVLRSATTFILFSASNMADSSGCSSTGYSQWLVRLDWSHWHLHCMCLCEELPDLSHNVLTTETSGLAGRSKPAATRLGLVDVEQATRWLGRNLSSLDPGGLVGSSKSRNQLPAH